MVPFFQSRAASRRWRCRLQLLGGWLLLTFIPFFCYPESTAGVTPSDVEAAYLYNFAKFVRWPAAQAEAAATLSICVLGDDGFAESLNALTKDETLDGRKISSERLSTLTAASNCQMIFIGQSEEPHLARDLALLQKKSVLTVSGLPGFLEHGGMIQFVIQNKRVRFAVNLPAAEQRGLSLSSELLKVALYVNSKPAQEAR